MIEKQYIKILESPDFINFKKYAFSILYQEFEKLFSLYENNEFVEVDIFSLLLFPGFLIVSTNEIDDAALIKLKFNQVGQYIDGNIQ